ncbi:MAG UNVERIFIED_CONTAM: hypothetical protein LVQ98_08685 [Rickettsiaceae bacterium]|jgi:hypothetical protein
MAQGLDKEKGDFTEGGLFAAIDSTMQGNKDDLVNISLVLITLLMI